MRPILTVTLNPAIDMSTRVLQVEPDRKLRCSAPRREPGGGGIDVARAVRRLGGASRALHLAGGPTDLYARVTRIAAERDARAVVDTSGEALRAAVDAGVYLVKLNLREFHELVGRELEDDAEREAEARRLIERGRCHAIVISLGAGGVHVVTADGGEFVRSPTVPIRSRVGAGDSTVAGIVLGLARGMELAHAVRFGVAAGAAAVMTEGTELCRRNDTERLYEEISGAD